MSILPFSGAIYLFQNMISGGVYVGQTISKPARRRGEHLRLLRQRKHGNPHLQYAWNKYSEHAFEFCILETFNTIEETNEAEIFYIQYFRSIGVSLYNSKSGGAKGRSSKDAVAKQRAALIGYKHSTAARQRMSASRLGSKRTLSIEAKAAIAAANRQRIGSKSSDKTKAKISAAGQGRNLGRRMSDAAKAKHSAAKLRKNAARLEERTAEDSCYMFLSPDNLLIRVKSLTAFTATYGLHAGHVSDLVHGRRKFHHGWSFVGIGE